MASRPRVPRNLARPGTLTTPRLTLTALTDDDLNDRYVSWLNDSDVLRYRAARSGFDLAGLERYLFSAASRGDVIFAMRLRPEGEHIGNITLNSILDDHKSAEISMMIGAKHLWGRGYAQEAIGAVTSFGFDVLGLHRLWAESPNPAFNRAVARLGWTHEGTKREAFWIEGHFVDVECFGLLRSEHQR